MIGAYIAFAFAVVCFSGAVRQWSFPLAGDRQHRQELTTPFKSPDDPPLVPPSRSNEHLENPANKPDSWSSFDNGLDLSVGSWWSDRTGAFSFRLEMSYSLSYDVAISAQVVRVVDGHGVPLKSQQTWPIPWVDSGSIEPRCPRNGARLDFAQYDRRAWWFASVPKPIKFSAPSALEDGKHQLIVTVRVNGPDGYHVDRRFSIGFSHGRPFFDQLRG
jgi:hypothetical protein